MVVLGRQRRNGPRPDRWTSREVGAKRDGSGPIVQNAVENAAEEAALRAGPAIPLHVATNSTGRPIKAGRLPVATRSPPESAGRASRSLGLRAPGRRTVPPRQPQDEPTTRGPETDELLRYRGIAVRLG